MLPGRLSKTSKCVGSDSRETGPGKPAMQDRPRNRDREDESLPPAAKQYRNQDTWNTWGRNTIKKTLDGDFGSLGRKTKQINNPFASVNRKFTLPGRDPIFWKLRNRAPSLDPCWTGYTEASGHQPWNRVCTCGGTALPPGHPPGWEESSSHPTSAFPRPRMTFLETHYHHVYQQGQCVQKSWKEHMVQ